MMLGAVYWRDETLLRLCASETLLLNVFITLGVYVGALGLLETIYSIRDIRYQCIRK